MNEHVPILLLTTTANLLFGLSVWLKNFNERVNQYFALFSTTVAGWALSNGLVAIYAGTPSGTVWARTAFVFAALIPLAFFLFVQLFPVQLLSLSRRGTIFWLCLALLVAVLSVTPMIARDTSATGGRLSVNYGPLHPLFGLYFLSCLAYSIYLLSRKLHVLRGIERLQVRYVMLGISLPVLAGTITNLLVPIVFRSSFLSPYGPLFSIAMIGVIAHAIIRHRLLQIRVVIRSGVAYLLAIAASATVFVTLLWLSSRILVSTPNELPFWMQLALVILIAIAFQPFQRNVQSLLDRYLFREPYDYQRTVREISKTMASILDLRPLLDYACEAITRAVQPEFVAVYIREVHSSTHRQLVLHASVATAEHRAPGLFESGSHLVSLLSAEQRPILLSEKLRDSASTLPQDEGLQELIAIHAELSVPIVEEGRLTGFLLLGPRLSGDPYFSADIDLLTTLAGQATIAFKNAQLYSQVVLANEYIENILSTIDSGVIAVSSNGTVALFNSAAANMTGLTASEVKGATLKILPPAIAEAVRATMADRKGREHLQGLIQDKSSRLIPIISSTSVLRDRAGTTLGVVAVFNDLTRLHELEGEKRRAERLASIGALASGITHEIKNPLVAIKTFAELLPERFSDEEFRRDFSKIVIQEIERIDELLAKLRGIATHDLRRTLVDVRPSIEETLALLRGQIEQAHVFADLSFDDNLPLVEANPAQLKQLFLNLFMNALEAMKSGGTLSISVSHRETAFDERFLHIEISDTGVGIPERMIDTIFDPFVTTKPQGSGLGLSICRGIVEAHRATIRARNNPAQGACLVLDFPAAEPTPTTIG